MSCFRCSLACKIDITQPVLLLRRILALPILSSTWLTISIPKALTNRGMLLVAIISTFSFDSHGVGLRRAGLCTTFLEELAARLHDNVDSVESMRAEEEVMEWYEVKKELEMPTQTADSGMNRLLALSESMKGGLSVPLYLRPSLGFSPPESVETPLIMVGPGTGIAPFLGFLEER